MHYANGREAKIGDKVVGRDHAGNPVSGVVVDQNVSESCNLSVLPLPITGLPTYTAKEFLHVDDALPKNPTP